MKQNTNPKLENIYNGVQQKETDGGKGSWKWKISVLSGEHADDSSTTVWVTRVRHLINIYLLHKQMNEIGTS